MKSVCLRSKRVALWLAASGTLVACGGAESHLGDEYAAVDERIGAPSNEVWAHEEPEESAFVDEVVSLTHTIGPLARQTWHVTGNDSTGWWGRWATPESVTAQSLPVAGGSYERVSEPSAWERYESTSRIRFLKPGRYDVEQSFTTYKSDILRFRRTVVISAVDMGKPDQVAKAKARRTPIPEMAIEGMAQLPGELEAERTFTFVASGCPSGFVYEWTLTAVEAQVAFQPLKIDADRFDWATSTLGRFKLELACQLPTNGDKPAYRAAAQAALTFEVRWGARARPEISFPADQTELPAGLPIQFQGKCPPRLARSKTPEVLVRKKKTDEKWQFVTDTLQTVRAGGTTVATKADEFGLLPVSKTMTFVEPGDYEVMLACGEVVGELDSPLVSVSFFDPIVQESSDLPAAPSDDRFYAAILSPKLNSQIDGRVGATMQAYTRLSFAVGCFKKIDGKIVDVAKTAGVLWTIHGADGKVYSPQRSTLPSFEFAPPVPQKYDVSVTCSQESYDGFFSSTARLLLRLVPKDDSALQVADAETVSLAPAYSPQRAGSRSLLRRLGLRGPGAPHRAPDSVSLWSAPPPYSDGTTNRPPGAIGGETIMIRTDGPAPLQIASADEQTELRSNDNEPSAPPMNPQQELQFEIQAVTTDVSRMRGDHETWCALVEAERQQLALQLANTTQQMAQIQWYLRQLCGGVPSHSVSPECIDSR